MKFIIRWNAGYGNDREVVEAKDREEAQQFAYEAWREEAENNADYAAEEWTEELEEEYDL